jgi:hypothetical protein
MNGFTTAEFAYILEIERFTATIAGKESSGLFV